MTIPKIRVNIPIIKPPTGAIVMPNIIHYLLFKIIMSSARVKYYLHQTETLLLIYNSQHTPNNKKNTNNEVKR